MFVKYTEAEQQEMNRLYEQQRLIFEDERAEREKLLDEYPPPDTDDYYRDLDREADPAAYEKARAAWEAAMDEWEKNQPPAWSATYNEQQKRLNSRLLSNGEQLGKIRTNAINRHFKALEGNPAALLADAKDQAVKRVTALINEYETTERREGIQAFSGEALASLGNGLWKLNADELRDLIKEGLQRHYDMLADEADLTGKLADQLNAFIDEYLMNNPYVTTERGIEQMVRVSQELIRTQYPFTLATPADKVSKKLFAGELTDQLQPLAMERRKSHRPIDTLASVTLQNIKGMTWYDGSVYSAICALYVRGKNEYISLQMIHQTMTGKEDARLSQTQAKAISESISKAMREVITIDATSEAARHKIQGSLKYGTNLLHAEWVKRNLNGTITECYHILKTPVLYEYAASKNQIANPPIAALATPVNKNKDTTALQAYLLDRIWGMKGGADERDIAYSTLYSAVWGKKSASAKGESGGYIRLKKSRLRSSAFKILEHWTKPESGNLQIKGFEEYKQGKTARGIRIYL